MGYLLLGMTKGTLVNTTLQRSCFTGTVEVLKDINAEVQEKEVICVIGPSGSGKSTFLRCLNLLEEVTDGEVVINGHDITDLKENQYKQSPARSWNGFPTFQSISS